MHEEDGRPNELHASFKRSATPPRGYLPRLQLLFPVLRIIVRLLTPRSRPRADLPYGQPTANARRNKESLAVVRRIGSQLIAERKAAVLAEAAGGGVAKGDIEGHDLLSLLIRSNLAADMPDSMRMSDEEILSRAFFFPCHPFN